MFVTNVVYRYCYGADGKETPLLTYTSESAAASTSQSAVTPVAASITAAPQTTAVTACHKHDTEM